MVSKTILACLAALACLSMTSATQRPNFGYCVSGVTYINEKFSLGLVIRDLLGGVLNLVGNVLNGVLGVVTDLLGGGGSHKEIPYVDAPNNIQSCAAVLVKVGPVYGKLIAPVLGSDFASNIFADVHGVLSLNLLNLLRLDLGKATFLKNGISLDVAIDRVAKISAILNSNRFKSGAWVQVSVLINNYLNLVSKKSINVDLYVSATLQYIKIQVALLKMAGYPNVDQYANTWVQTCNNVFPQIGYSKPILIADVTVSGVQRNCNCFK